MIRPGRGLWQHDAQRAFALPQLRSARLVPKREAQLRAAWTFQANRLGPPGPRHYNPQIRFKKKQVPEVGVEPTRPYGHRILNPARLARWSVAGSPAGSAKLVRLRGRHPLSEARFVRLARAGLGGATMTLQELVSEYGVHKDVRPVTLLGYKIAVESFKRWIGRDPRIEDLSIDNINHWLHSLRSHGKMSPYTTANRRRNLLVIARWAYERGKTSESFEGRFITNIKCPPTPKSVWNEEQIVHLVRCVEQLPAGLIHKTLIDRHAFWRTAIMAAWDTALRWTDMGRLTLADIDDSGCVNLVQNKTGIEHRVRLTESTLAEIDRSFVGRAGKRKLIWPTPYDRWRFLDFRRLTQLAGLVGSFKQLRRSAITAAERRDRGSGMLLAGHTDAATTNRWYINRAELLDALPVAPDIWKETMDEKHKRALKHRMKRNEAVELVSPDGHVAQVKVERDDKGRTSLVLLTPIGQQPFELRKTS